MADIVIGSGPAGIAVALARLARGREVVLLDGGRDLEAEAAGRRRAASSLEPATWPEATRSEWMSRQFDTPAGQVRRFGSDFAMEPAESTFAGGDPIALRASRAVGGLSNLWGAAMLPWRQEDIRDWPVTVEELTPSWQAVARLVPVAGREDDLQSLFPALPMKDRVALSPGPQIERLLERFAARRGDLATMGVHAGQSRQAVQEGCRHCGLCLHGCPWGLIWSARDALGTLRADPRLTYRPGAVVRAVEDGPDRARALLADGTAVAGERVFLAAGVLETARILMASPAGPGEMVLKDSQFAFLPLVHRWPAPRRPDVMPFHTLAQAFVEVADPAVSPHLVHAQLYGWNEFYARDLRQRFGGRLGFASPALEALARRLVVAQVFIHSSHSHAIALRPAADGRLLARVLANPESEPTLRKALRKLSEAMRLAGLHGLRFAARAAEPGASFHVGASLPMAGTPAQGQSDRIGRPRGAVRLHVVDASVLPAIPATTITFGVMGNAHRIGLEAPFE